jgi:hypothetical protein
VNTNSGRPSAIAAPSGRWGTWHVVAALSGLSCVATVAVAVASARSLDYAAVSPLVPAAGWHDALRLAVVASFLSYVLGVVALRREPLQPRVALGFGAAVQLLPLVAPTLLSTDVHVYEDYGRKAVFDDQNPYLEREDNPVPSVYGPLFTLFSEALSLFVRDEGAAEVALRIVAAGSVIAVAVLAGRLADDRSFAIAFVAWNPLLALHFAGGGHNDALMVALVLCAVLLAHSGRRHLAGVAWAASIFVKWLSAAFLPLIFAESPAQRRRPSSVTLAASGLALAVVATLWYGDEWFRAGLGLARTGTRTGSIGVSHWLQEIGVPDRARELGVEFAQVCALLALAWRAHATGRARLGLAACLFAILQGWLNPWYAVWGVGLAAADETDGLGRALAVILSGYLLLDVTTW